MTGTSVDSVDTALCRFYMESGSFRFDLLNYKEYEINSDIRKLIFRITSNKFTIKELSQLNFYLAYLFSDCSQGVCKEIGFDFKNVDLISIHGQTLWHNPIPEQFTDKFISSSLQLTSISALSAILKKEVIGDFRAADIALGGQGAPLVPIFDYYFLRDEKKDIVALNIGGIANITIIPKNCSSQNLIGFDTGPGNMLIDIAVSKYFNKKFDENGEIAKSGQLIEKLYKDLLRIDFIYQVPPKSTGREFFNYQLLNSMVNEDYLPNDVIRTITQFSAFSIAHNIKKYAPINSMIVVSGGGRMNSYLIDLLNTELIDYDLMKIDELNINGDAKEAICFAFLGYLYKMHLHGNINSISGATKEIILGVSANNI